MKSAIKCLALSSTIIRLNHQLKHWNANINQNAFWSKETFGEEIIALNPLIDVFQLDFEKFECCRLLVCYSN